METREEVKIEMIEADGPISKENGSFSLPITYVLANGERVPSRYTRDRKRDVTTFAATLPTAPENPMWANYRDGVYIGTKTSFYIGPRG